MKVYAINNVASDYDMKGSLKKMAFSVQVNAMHLYSHQMEGGSLIQFFFLTE
jgi:hypothetical protein